MGVGESKTTMLPVVRADLYQNAHTILLQVKKFGNIGAGRVVSSCCTFEAGY
jgi:hypothetical protein